MTLGEKIRSLRKKRGWSQAELGDKLGFAGQNVSRYETDRIRPRKKTLELIADVFEVSVEELQGDAAEEEFNSIKDPEILECVKMLKALNQEDRDAAKRMLRAMFNNAKAQSLFAS